MHTPTHFPSFLLAGASRYLVILAHPPLSCTCLLHAGLFGNGSLSVLTAPSYTSFIEEMTLAGQKVSAGTAVCELPSSAAALEVPFEANLAVPTL